MVFVCATTGQGDEPDNMRVSYNHIKEIYYHKFNVWITYLTRHKDETFVICYSEFHAYVIVKQIFIFYTTT